MNPTVPTDDEYLQVFGGLYNVTTTLTNVYTYLMGGGYYCTFTATNCEFNINNADINDPFQVTLNGTIVASAYGDRAGNSKFIVNAGATLNIDADTEGGSVLTLDPAAILNRTTKASNVNNDSSVTGVTVKDALETLDAILPVPGPTGATGTTGAASTVPGPMGTTGAIGTTGAVGTTGATGTTGTNGVDGADFIASDVGDIDFTLTGPTLLYTVSMGRKFVITQELFICESASSVMVKAYVSTGSNSAMYDNGISSKQPAPVNAGTCSIMTQNLASPDTASQVFDATLAPIDIYLNVSVAASATSQKMRCILFGAFIS